MALCGCSDIRILCVPGDSKVHHGMQAYPGLPWLRKIRNEKPAFLHVQVHVTGIASQPLSFKAQSDVELRSISGTPQMTFSSLLSRRLETNR